MRKLDPSEGIALFTDGSANYQDRSGGWGWVAIDHLGNKWGGAGHAGGTTINQMELHAPTDGLSWLHEHYGSCNVLVYSDSEYVVLGCNDRTRSRLKNPKWWKRLDHAIELHEYVEWNHVRGHADNYYNELADDLAGRARKRGIQNADPKHK